MELAAGVLVRCADICRIASIVCEHAEAAAGERSWAHRCQAVMSDSAACGEQSAPGFYDDLAVGECINLCRSILGTRQSL